MAWANIRVVNLNSAEELQEILDLIKEQCSNVYFRKREYHEDIGQNAYIEETETQYRITFKPGLKAITYVFDRDGDYLVQCKPLHAASAMSHVYKIQRTEDILGIKPEQLESATPLLYKNPKYNGKATLAYEYDLVEAYLQMLKLPLPDLRTLKRDTEIGNNQVGFYPLGESLKCCFKEGVYCDYVFDLMESPYKEWADKLHRKVLSAKTREEKKELKSRYRFAIGCLQNINPFWRCIIVERCNQEVSKYIDDSTIYCNTDSLVSARERNDILQTSQFEWAIKKKNKHFKWQLDKLNYQWEDYNPAYRGAAKRYIRYYNQTHDVKWDILTDEVPKDIKHKYNLNKEKLKIYEEK